MASTHVFLLISILSLLFFTSPSSSSSNPAANAITIPLSRLFAEHPSSDTYQILHLVASASIRRAVHIKHPKSTPTVKTPLFPKSYGGYSIDLSFGTPSQAIPFVFDTGSSLVWFPCTSRYLCSKCNFPNIEPGSIHSFIPKNSTSSKIVGCRNPKCGWVFGQGVQSRCRYCSSASKNCTQACPGYMIQYGLGSTAGIFLLENLNFPEKIVPDFLVGCSVLSVRQPSGIVGFGRGPQSLPAQMDLKKFSYCLLSHRYDGLPESSNLILDTESSGNTKTIGLSYSPFRRNPGAKNTAFQEYYYLTVRNIIVGDKAVKIPYKFLVPDSEGNGGTIIDSGSTFTFMEGPLLATVAGEFEKQMGNYTRAKDIEASSGLGLCFHMPSHAEVTFPKLTFVFKGGARMVLPLPNYFSSIGSKGVVCLTMISDGGIGSGVSVGPSIILGNYQQQNFDIEYDLENDRFGFRQKSCKRSQ